MSSTPEDVCNLALFRVRADEIGSLDEQSVNAEKCRVLYPHIRDMVLTEYPWGFARATRALSRKEDTPVEWEYAFDYPNDCVKARYLVPTNDQGETISGYNVNLYDEQPIHWELGLGEDGKKVILTNYEHVHLVYTRQVDDVLLWDALFTDLLAWRLAVDLAIPLGGDSGKAYRSEAMQQARMAEGYAKAKHANEKWPREPQQAPRSIQARGETVLSRDQLIYRRGY
jgi:hypothetical protein